MAQKREIEETESKFPENISVCNATIPASRSPEASDLKACDCRNLCEDSMGGGLKKRRREATRCSGSGCRKRIGLIGFRCRCGDVFCSEHRYSDRHDCSFDYKAAGREAIARENPVVRAAKLVKDLPAYASTAAAVYGSRPRLPRVLPAFGVTPRLQCSEAQPSAGMSFSLYLNSGGAVEAHFCRFPTPSQDF